MVSRMCGYGVKIVVARTHAKVFSFFTIQRVTNDFDVCLELEREMREDYEIATVKIKTLLFLGRQITTTHINCRSRLCRVCETDNEKFWKFASLRS